MTSALKILQLNTRVALLALRGKWLNAADVARGYDLVAPTYNNAWQARIRPATDSFLARLPADILGRVLDLGCGTGYSSRQIAKRYPAAHIVGIDVSPGMLVAARGSALPNTEFIESDMLAYVRQAPPSSVRMIVSTWAMGYSNPPLLIRHCAHALQPEGVFAFIVNYFDTLAPVFRAYQKCMFQFPERIQRAACPQFPKNWPRLHHQLSACGFHVEWHADGNEPIHPPDGPLLPWLRQTGILAGFDAMLDLSGPAADTFEREIRTDTSPLFHHYAAAIAVKS